VSAAKNTKHRFFPQKKKKKCKIEKGVERIKDV
jgi:hypothetical protein